MPVKKILIKEITRDPRTQMREKELDPAVVNDYALAMENGDEFPEITVFSEDGRSPNYILADGWYRTAAAEKLLGADGNIRADIRKGGMRKAILFAAGANHPHGVRRTNADKRKAVETLLKDEEWTVWSDGVIAKHVKVSQPFVSSMRRGLEKLVEEAPGSTQKVLSAAPAKRKGADGRMRSTSTTRAPKTPADPKPEPVKVTDKRLFDAGGNPRDVAPAAAGPSPGYIAVDEKEKPIAELLAGKPLVVMFQFIPKVPGITVVVHRNDPPSASRKQIGTAEMPRLPDPILKLIEEQLNGKGAK